MVLAPAITHPVGDTRVEDGQPDPGGAGPVSGSELVAALHGVLDRAAGADLDADAAGQGELVGEIARAESRLSALKLRVLEAAERDRTARQEGVAGTDQWYADRTRTDRKQAARDVGLATGLRKRPATRDALAQGAITPDHARVITNAERQLPDSVTRADRDRIERRLVDQAQQMAPGQLRRAARRAIAEVEPDEETVDAHEDDQLRDEERRARERTRLVLHDNADGTMTGHFTLPTFYARLLQKILETMTAPRRARPGASAAHAGHRTGGDTDWARARGEAFCELLEHLPTDHLAGKNAATVVVTLDQEVLQGSLRAAGLDTGEEISSSEARRLACQAGIVPAVLGGASLPLDLGRTRRLFTEAQRTAIGLKHQHCAADGCERPFSWCELHHHTPWSAGGKTDVAEAVPLCHFHHQRIHDPGFVHREHPDGSLTFEPVVRRAS